MGRGGEADFFAPSMRIGKRKKRKLFSVWQIELTTRCPLQCKMCIRSERKDWQYQDMPLEKFKKILPSLREVETVVLEGWGESLLHPDLLECIELVKQEGSEVGFVTSGNGLDRPEALDLIKAGLDFIGFSIAGTTVKTHEGIRLRSRLGEIIDAVQFIREERARAQRPQPRMHLVFLMMKDNIHEVPEVPSFARELGIEEVVLINVCHTLNTWQAEQPVFVWDEGQNPYEEFLRQAETRARKLHIKLRRPSLSAADVPICDENPLKNLYISCDGEVSPCVYLFPPLPSPFKRIFRGREYWIEKMSFGNIFNEAFSAIWNRESYARFRQAFVLRQTRCKDLYFSLFDSPHRASPEANALTEPPEDCKSCHKILGV